MTQQSRFVAVAVMFFGFAVVFSVVFWPGIPTVAKLAFFAAGVGCGVGLGRSIGAAAAAKE